jgi:hypothetical protein
MEPWQRIEAASRDEARVLLQTCSGSPRWTQRIDRANGRTARRRSGALSAGRDGWFTLEYNDWLDEFRHHPKIDDHDVERTPVRDGCLNQKNGAQIRTSDALLEPLAQPNCSRGSAVDLGMIPVKSRELRAPNKRGAWTTVGRFVIGE